MDNSHDFGWALEGLKNGEKVYREGWNAHHTLSLQQTTSTSKMTQPYIYMTTFQGALVPWVASQTDLLAEDWKATV